MMNALTRCCVPSWLRLALLLVGLGLAPGHAAAGEWPEGYAVSEDTVSPDGRHGLVIPVDRDTVDPVNYLADLKEKRLIGKIAKGNYIQRESRRSLQAFWSPDSRWCVVEYGERYGFGSVCVLEVTGSRFTQTDVGRHIQGTLDAAITRQSRGAERSGNANVSFRLGPGRSLRVRARASNNPKQFTEVKTFYAAFAGTFDLKTKRWFASRARKIEAEDDEAMESAYADLDGKEFIVLPEGEDPPDDFDGQVFRSEEARAEKLDAMLNGAYRIVRRSLPPARFAAVKAEQIAWLKRRDALATEPEKAKLTFERVKALQDLVW